jgi:hypothetical protein
VSIRRLADHRLQRAKSACLEDKESHLLSQASLGRPFEAAHRLVVGSHRGGVLVECTARLDPVGGDAYHCLSGQHNALVTPAGFEGLWAVQVRKILRVA